MVSTGRRAGNPAGRHRGPSVGGVLQDKGASLLHVLRPIGSPLPSPLLPRTHVPQPSVRPCPKLLLLPRTAGTSVNPSLLFESNPPSLLCSGSFGTGRMGEEGRGGAHKIHADPAAEALYITRPAPGSCTRRGRGGGRLRPRPFHGGDDGDAGGPCTYVH